MDKTRKEDIERMLQEVERIYSHRGVTEEEKALIWQTLAASCLYQLEQKQGLFYETAKPLLEPPHE